MANQKNTTPPAKNESWKDDTHQVLRPSVNWRTLHCYQKADTLYQITHIFCQRFLPAHGDRTVDQMVQAARSGKQNIVEGIEDGKTSTEMELKLLNVARASLKELQEDYQDYINSRRLDLWTPQHPRYQPMLDYTSAHNCPNDYLALAQQWSAEEFCNTALTLCHQTDTLINGYLRKLEKDFTQYGGIKERMHAARTGYRQQQDARLRQLETDNAQLQQQLAALQQAYDSLKARALAAYNTLQTENAQLKAALAQQQAGKE